MTRNIVYSLILLLVLAATGQSAKYSGDAFSLGVGGRALALGGAVIAGPFDGTAPYWNPAGMNHLSGRRLTAMHAETFGSLLNHDYVGYIDARRTDSDDNESLVQAFGFYLYYLGGGGIKITRLNQYSWPYVVREESHGDWLFSAAISGKISSRIDFGLTGKIIYRDIGTESGLGLTMDAGALYQPNRYVNLGLMVTDITSGFIRYSGNTELFDNDGAVVAHEANTESIYPTVKPGFMLEYQLDEFTGRMMVSGDIKFEGLRFGAQYWSGPLSLDTHYGWEIGYKQMLFGRAGFDIGRLTLGGGVNFRKFAIDFAYLHHDFLDETFRVSAGYRF